MFSSSSENDLWERFISMAQNRTPIQITVSTFNAGGWLCYPFSQGPRGFIPNSQVLDPPASRSQLIGEALEVIVTEVDPSSRKLVLSEKDAWKDKHLKIGTSVNGKISRNHDNGLLVDLGHGILGLLDKSSNDLDGFKLGDNVLVWIVDKQGNSRISLALNNQPTVTEQPEQALADCCLSVEGTLFFRKSKELLSSAEELSDSEFVVLRCLFQHPGETVSYNLLQELIPNSDIETIRGIVHQLRRHSSLEKRIKNERGSGYCLEVSKD